LLGKQKNSYPHYSLVLANTGSRVKFLRPGSGNLGTAEAQKPQVYYLKVRGCTGKATSGATRKFILLILQLVMFTALTVSADERAEAQEITSGMSLLLYLPYVTFP
jgi:hypothetical protein